MFNQYLMQNNKTRQHTQTNKNLGTISNKMPITLSVQKVCCAAISFLNRLLCSAALVPRDPRHPMTPIMAKKQKDWLDIST